MRFGFLKRLGTLLGVICAFVGQGYGLTNVPPGNVSGVWTAANSPYVIKWGSVTVPNGSVLVILPGTRVEFRGHHKFTVNGHLRAVGTVTDSVVFTGTGNVGVSGWKGLRLSGADSTQFDYCVIENGNAINGTSQDSTGGGAYVSGSGTHVIFRHCSFRNNFAGSNGGALFVSGGTSAACYDCDFIGNRTAKDGGAAFVNNSSGSRFERCEFFQNRSGKEAGAIHTRFGAPTFIDCYFHHNSCYNSGGAVMASGQPSFRRCVFERNTAEVSQGGGIYFYDATTTAALDSCLFIQNRTLLRDGGGAFCWESAPRFTDCQFIQNESADDGGGIHCYRIGANPIFTRCLFDGNTAADRGGGMKVSRESRATITDCEIRNNRSLGTGGGGVFCRLQAEPVFTNCVIENNFSTGSGGGIAAIESYPRLVNCELRNNETDSLGGGAYGYNSDLDMTDCELSENHAFMHGGGLYLSSSSPDYVRCRIQDNTADSLGGALYLTSALPTFSNCLITGNKSDVMGGVAVVYSSNPTFLHCTMANNVSPVGNSFVISESPGTIINSILSGSIDSLGNGGGSSGAGFIGGSVAWTIQNSVIHAIGTPSFVGAVPVGIGEIVSVNANGTACDGYGNLTSDPRFVGVGPEPFMIDEAVSPVKGAGTLLTIFGDILGSQRPGPVGSLPDIGCFESDQPNGSSGLWGEVTGSLHDGEYKVHGDIIVPFGQELEIKAGAELEFMGPYGIFIYGKLNVEGIATDSVVMYCDTIANQLRWRGLRFYGNESSESKLRYLSVFNAATSAIDSSGGGFGIFAGASPAMESVSIHDCRSSTEGGAMNIVDGSPTLTDCEIVECAALSGGAIRVEPEGALSLTGGKIERCQADIGGAISTQGGAVVIRQTLLAENAAEEGGAVHARNAPVELSNVSMTQNSSTLLGGALYGSGSEFSCDSLYVRNSSSNVGGGLYLSSCSGTMSGLVFANNFASGSGGAARISGGSMYLSRGVFNSNIAGQTGGSLRLSSDSSRIERCTIIESYATSGSAIYFENSHAVVTSSQITNNGPALYFQGSSGARIQHSNFNRNNGVNFQNYQNNSNNGPAQIGVLSSANHLEYTSDQYSNIYSDPLYADYDNGDLHVLISSPCVDAGSPLLGCDPDLSYVEIGAYHTPYEVLPWAPEKLSISAEDSVSVRLHWSRAKTTRLCDEDGLHFEVEKLDTSGVWARVYATPDTTCVLPLDSAQQNILPLRVRSAVAP